MTLKDICSTRLKNSAERLLKLIELGAPTAIIGTEISMLLQRAAPICGDTIFQTLGRNVGRSEKWRLGYCLADDCVNKLQNKEEFMEGYCSTHLEELKTEEDYSPRYNKRQEFMEGYCNTHLEDHKTEED